MDHQTNWEEAPEEAPEVRKFEFKSFFYCGYLKYTTVSKPIFLLENVIHNLNLITNICVTLSSDYA